MIKILANDGMQADAVKALQAKGYEVCTQHYDPEQLAGQIGNFDVLTVRSATKVRQPLIDAAAAAGRLKLIIRGGVGIDNIDAEYAEEKGIHVTNTPRASSVSVAELVLAHMFSMCRFVGISNVTMRQGEWNKKSYEGTEINGKTLGLIGMGRIAQELASRAQALGMNIVYFDILGKLDSVPYQYLPLEEVLRQADFLSLHIPGNPDQQPLIGARELALMKPTAYVINTARGNLVDLPALCAALNGNRLAGAAFDVFPEEPICDEHLLCHKCVSLTPHIGGSTKEAQLRIGAEIVEIIEDFFAAQ